MMGRNGIMAFLPTTALPAVDQIPDPIFAREAPAGRIDGAAIAAVTDLYREMLPPGGAILDVMSGWISHLPPEAPFRRVVGVGVDRRALAENPFLDEWRAQDLNRDPVLPFANGEFDGATLCGAIRLDAAFSLPASRSCWAAATSRSASAIRRSPAWTLRRR